MFRRKLCVLAIGLAVLTASCGSTDYTIDKNYFEDIYKSADGHTEEIIKILGENGISAVDSENQINMTCADKAEEFCRSVEEKEDAKLTIAVVYPEGGLTQYDLDTADGAVHILRNDYQYENGALENINMAEYEADTWKYEDGYLFFGGSRFSEVYTTLLLSDMPEETAIRVLPLEEKYKKLNRKYILPIGYVNNNMFIENWNTDDFGGLDFYDMFDIFHRLLYKKKAYPFDPDLSVGAVYQVPEEEFEGVIMDFFDIDKDTLRERTVYYDGFYEYKPRGFYETDYDEGIYPEVVDCKENADGTLELTVNAVYPQKGTAKEFTHVTVVDPETGKYVSNKIISSEDIFDWHKPRLTKEGWEEIYGQ